MSTAVLLIDLQHDFLSPDGAYGRAGLGNADLAALPARVAPVLDAARAAAVPIVSAQFTIVARRGRPPQIAEHLHALRPFLGPGDFEPGRRGHDLVDALAPADVVVEKVAFSAFHQSRLEWVLQGLGADHLLVAGIVTNGGVASTVRDAHVRGLATTLLADGCAAFDREAHDATLRSLRGVTRLSTCAGAIGELAAGA
ncbi:cysteine hydrolase [Baekduia soli]|uniref:Cysteine hydrolase n=1 Tax=Baekduia soli TaxID=496014 RepID=A0A5B8TZH9_9ACTN|nr:cysteine hydrolase [Baekduia soli]QEC46128.1 cysteine hydrolase [Baekduia soli]